MVLSPDLPGSPLGPGSPGVPGAPAGPGTGTGTGTGTVVVELVDVLGGTFTVVAFSQALKPNTATSTANSIEYFMVIPFI